MSEGPVPIPTPETLPYWEGAKAGELRIQRCNACEKYYFYPRPYCPKCNSDDVEWRTVSGKGTLRSYVINQRPLPVFKSEEPQIIALVELDEGVRMMTNVIGIDPADVRIGMRVRATIDTTADEPLPLFVRDDVTGDDR